MSGCSHGYASLILRLAGRSRAGAGIGDRRSHQAAAVTGPESSAAWLLDVTFYPTYGYNS